MKKDKIKVLIVDDSAVVRQTMSELLSSDPDIEVIGTASDPFVAADRIGVSRNWKAPCKKARRSANRSISGPTNWPRS